MVETVDPRQLLNTAAVSPGSRLVFAGRELLLERSLRFLPGQRHVLRCREGGEQRILKLFADSRRSEWQRESAALQALAGRGVSVSPVLASAEEACPGLLMPCLPGVTADLVLQRATSHEATALIRRLLAFCADLHHRGALQKDIHPGNFLVDDSAVVLLDAGSVQIGDSLTQSLRQQNLMLLLAQFYPAQLQQIENLWQELAAFGDARPSQEALPKLLFGARAARYRHFLRKTRRPCTAFEQLVSPGGSGMCRRELAADCRALLAAGIDEVLESGERLKSGNSATVAAVQWRGRSWVIKRYNLKSSLHRLKRQFGRSRAEISWQAANWFELVGIATPPPVMMWQTRAGLLRGEAYFVCEALQAPDVADFNAADSERLGINAALAGFVALMDQLRFSHGDMKATNFKWLQQKLWVLDLDAVRLLMRPRQHRRWHDKDRRRLLANWDDNPDLSRRLD